MLVLAFDTSTPVGSLALLENDGVRICRFFDIGLQHSRWLFTEISEAMAVAQRKINEVDVVAVTVGPGSFTGLRIGLAAAKGLCLARNQALVTVSTLEALAARLPFAMAPVCSLIDARRGQVYAALYDTSSGFPTALDEERVVEVEALLSERLATPTLYTGSGSAAYADLIDAGPLSLRAPDYLARPEAGAIAWLARRQFAQGAIADVVSTEPRYLRPPNLIEPLPRA